MPFAVGQGFVPGPEGSQPQRVAFGLTTGDGAPETGVGEQQRHHDQTGIPPTRQREQTGVENVVSTRTPRITVERVQYPKQHIGCQVRVAGLCQRIDPHRLAVFAGQDDRFLQHRIGDTGSDVGHQVSLGVDDHHGMSSVDVRQCQVGHEGGLPHTCRSDEVEVAQ